MSVPLVAPPFPPSTSVIRGRRPLVRLRRVLRSAQVVSALLVVLGLAVVAHDGRVADADHRELAALEAQRTAAVAAATALVRAHGDLTAVNSEVDLDTTLDELTVRLRETDAQQLELLVRHEAHRSLYQQVLWIVAGGLIAALALQWLLVLRPHLRETEREFEAIERREREHARLALLARRTTNCVIFTDPTGRVEWVNEGFVRITGYELPEVLGLHLAELVRSERADAEVVAALGAALAAGKPFSGELWNRSRTGRDYIVHVTMQPLHGEDGVLSGFMLMDADVTEERLLATELADRERQLRQIVEGTEVITWEFDPEQRCFTYIAPQVARYGYAVEDWLQPGFWERTLHSEDAAQAVQTCVASTSAGLDHRLQYRMVVPAGTFWIDDVVSVCRDADGRTLLRGAFIDITQQKESERELAEITELHRIESERFELALAGGSIGLWDWSPVDDSLHVNSSWARTLGVSLSELTQTGEDFRSRCHPDDLELAVAALQRHLAGRDDTYEVHHRMRHASGDWVYVVTRGRVVARAASGEATRIVGVQIDRTAEVVHESELQSLRARAEESSRTKGEFLANMSHEIRTPLTAILGYADMLREDGDLGAAPPARLAMIDTIRGAGQHLLAIINDVLDLSKIEAGGMTLEEVDASLSELLREVLRLLSQRASDKGIELSLDLSGAVPARVILDPTRLRQILMNLMGNAIKFTDSGSVTLRLSAEAETLEFQIADTGPGMSVQQAERLFHPFSQADGSVTRKFGGTGLGLSISRKLARLMGGEVVLVRTIPGEGSTFALHLPLRMADGVPWITVLDIHRETKAADLRPEPRSELRGKLLLVEDGPVNQRLIRALLERAGADVTVAGDGVEALAAISEERERGHEFDLIVTDMQMPVMDGYTLTAILRARGESVPVLALTAHAMAEDRQRCLDAGCDAYATKPIDRRELVATCAALLGRARGSAAA